MPNPSVLAQYVDSKKKEAYFSDMPTNFDMAPNSGDLALVTDTDAVVQSLENIIRTFIGERLYDNRIGSSVMLRTFELSSVIELETIKDAVKTACINNEPRVSLIDVTVDISGEENNFNITVVFYVINNSIPQTLQVKLKRTR